MHLEKALKIIGSHSREFDPLVEAARPMGACADVPEGDAARIQALQTIDVTSARIEAKQAAHQRPKRVARLRVILLALKRTLAGK